MLYGLPFVLTLIFMDFKALLPDSLFECSARGFQELLLFIAVICIRFEAFPRHYCSRYLYGLRLFPASPSELR